MFAINKQLLIYNHQFTSIKEKLCSAKTLHLQKAKLSYLTEVDRWNTDNDTSNTRNLRLVL